MRSTKLPTAADIMNRSVLTFTSDIAISEAIERLLKRGYSGAPVIDGDHNVVGVLSENDCIRVLSASAFHGEPDGTVGEHMTHEVVTVRPETDMFQLVFAFHKHTFRRVMVTDADGKLAGLITRRDLLRVLDRIRRERDQPERASTYDQIAAQHERDLNE
jgi:predicted transcriptional regulator